MKKLKPEKIPILTNNNTRRLLFVFWGLICFLNTNAQLYINGGVIVQAGETLYSSDSITLGTNQTLVVYGTVQSTKGINTNGNFIQTLNGGFIISPVSSGNAKNFDIGTSSNNRIQILQNSGSTVSYKLNVSDNVFTNPQTKITSINTNVINKTWTVQPLTTSNNTTISLFWNASDELSGFNRTNCAISRWQQNVTTSWSFTTGTATSQTTGASPSYSRTSSSGNLAASVYYFGVGGNGSSLPISLLEFNATNENEDTKLDWATSSEINNSHFEVQRSSDNTNWNQIAIVKGAGNSSIQNNYEFIDPNPYKILQVEKIYYRLKQVDLDEKYNFSQIKIVHKNDLNRATKVNIYPNPTNGNIYVHILNPASKNYQVEVIDIYGKTIRNNQLISTSNFIDLADLSSGIYFMKVIDTSSKTLISTNKIMKN